MNRHVISEGVALTVVFLIAGLFPFALPWTIALLATGWGVRTVIGTRSLRPWLAAAAAGVASAAMLALTLARAGADSVAGLCVRLGTVTLAVLIVATILYPGVLAWSGAAFGAETARVLLRRYRHVRSE